MLVGNHNIGGYELHGGGLSSQSAFLVKMNQNVLILHILVLLLTTNPIDTVLFQFVFEQSGAFTFLLCSVRFKCFSEKLQPLVVVGESGIFRVLFGLYYVVQSAGRSRLGKRQTPLGSFVLTCQFYT